MTLQSGTRLGAYEVLEGIGAGGMGEVYRARDSRLQRDVAIKVLPQVLSVDADMLARFGREAQLLAQLNHPNIAAVYGVEETGSIRALVLELVEGPTLAEVIDDAARAGRGVPVGDAVDIARQIALAMEAAHEQGIIHRDLKPGNVKLRPDGTVKVLDFGLAKAFDPVSTSASAAAFSSPTLSIRATQAGLILGTAAYMSPEQAKGKPVDRRADIWAFGVVLYEMLAGRPMYTGETVSEILARVIEREPDLIALPADLPRRLRELLRRCLVKDPRNRLRDIGEVRLALDEITARPDETDPAGVAAAVPQRAMPVWRRALPWGVTVIAALMAGAAAWAPWRTPPPAPEPIHLLAQLGTEATLGTGAVVTLSPDGQTLAFVAGGTAGDQFHVYVRRLDQLEATVLPSTVGARAPFFSPDGQWIGYFADRKLKKVAASGGAAVTLCDAAEPRGAAWLDDGTIVFSPGNRSTLMRVSAAGGVPQPASQFDTAAGDITHRFPHALPGGAFLFNSHTSGGNFDDASVIAQSTDGTRHTVRKGGSNPIYLHSGHLAYIVRGTLYAEPFAVATLKTTGASFPILEGIRVNPSTGAASLTVSRAGAVAYVRGTASGALVLLNAVNAAGQAQPIRTTPMDAFTVAIAPDGERVALDINDSTQLDVWVSEPARDVMTRLTTDPVDEFKPAWTPDGKRIAYGAAPGKDGKHRLMWRAADGGAEPQLLVASNNRMYPTSWHPSGRVLAYVESGANTAIKLLSIEGDDTTGWKPGTSTVFVDTSFGENEPSFSPDGKWIAYMSNASGRFEVYVRPFPGVGGTVQVSTNGGVTPRWMAAQQKLFFMSLEYGAMVASYSIAGTVFRPAKPVALGNIRIAARGPNRPFDAHRDGRLFVLQDAQAGEVQSADQVAIIFNAFEEFRRKAAGK